MEVIRVEHLSKLYDLGQVGTGTLSKDLNRWWARVRGKEDPYARIGQTNDRTKRAKSDDSVWALQDIDFSVRQGEVLGIIGRNGAGKSTLLKIISRITTPTSGTVKVRGRIASLLEVGTGFHPEMTGRENVFMNGTLLGMTRSEIQGKLEEIIDFAGVAMYIDTPVKRYSSGMQVRLAFAVAAFLEPEILIVDEVLAVGDAEFQKKAIGRMQEVSKGDGRTVLFVSHNLAAVSALCNRGLLMDMGRIVKIGSVNDAIDNYHMLNRRSKQNIKEWASQDQPANYSCKLLSVELVNLANDTIKSISTDDSFAIKIKYQSVNQDSRIGITLVLSDLNENIIFCSINNHEKNFYAKPMPNAEYFSNCVIPGNFLNSGNYSVSLILFGPNFTDVKEVKNILDIEIHDGINVRGDFHGTYAGVVRPKLEWETIKIANPNNSSEKN